MPEIMLLKTVSCIFAAEIPALKNKIPIHDDELQGIGAELCPYADLSDAPAFPHRDDHYMFVLQQKGVSVWDIDFKEHRLEETALCFVAPGQVHHYLESKNAVGWLIFINAELIPAEYRMMLDTVMHHHRAVAVENDHPVFALTDALHRFIAADKKILYRSIVQSGIGTLAGMLTAFLMHQHPGHVQPGSHKYQLVIGFKELIKQQFKEKKQVKDYATQLNITPLYLNEITKEVTGFAASHWIRREILLEARRLLSYTNMDIKEIAFMLGYEDHTYFSRFFKKNVGTAAGAFRQKNHHLSNHNL